MKEPITNKPINEPAPEYIKPEIQTYTEEELNKILGDVYASSSAWADTYSDLA